MAIIFSCFDFKPAYNQVGINKGDQHKTAFSSPWGLFEFTRMPFGLVNAPATFQRIMSNLFREEIYKFVVCYLDDILVYSKSYKEHIKHIGIVMEKLEGIVLKLNAKKCRLFIRQVVFLGSTISKEGI